jgi:glycosyltransferase involved in cell wall biosynthesis
LHFLLAGKGCDPENLGLVEAIARASLTDRVHLLGKRNDIPTVMAALDVLVSASSYGEAFPNVVAEAMASGIPCVVTDVGDSGYIVGETGVVVDPSDMPGLAQAVSALLSCSPEVRANLGLRARARVQQLFGLKMVVDRYEQLYEQVIAREHGQNVMP